MRVIVWAAQFAVFVFVTVWITEQNKPESLGLAPAVFGLCAAYIVTVWPIKILDWVRYFRAPTRRDVRQFCVAMVPKFRAFALVFGLSAIAASVSYGSIALLAQVIH